MRACSVPVAARVLSAHYAATLVTWAGAVGYVYATAQTLAHVDLEVGIDPAGFPAVTAPAAFLAYGDCSQSPVVLAGLYFGVDQANMAIGLAAALSPNILFEGWNVSRYAL